MSARVTSQDKYNKNMYTVLHQNKSYYVNMLTQCVSTFIKRRNSYHRVSVKTQNLVNICVTSVKQHLAK